MHILPDWPVARRVQAFCTARHDGFSDGPWASFNLGNHCGDRPEHVAKNRQHLCRQLPAEPCWLVQVHGDRIVHLDQWCAGIEADASWTERTGQVAAILTADCLPVLLADEAGTVVAAVHAGWRGLAAGILERAVAALPDSRHRVHAWIGPSICGRCYQVGDDVRRAMTGADPAAAEAFVADGERWRADLKSMASLRLQRQGVIVSDAARCTHCEPDEFYSYRRDGITGRMASVIWLE